MLGGLRKRKQQTGRRPSAPDAVCSACGGRGRHPAISREGQCGISPAGTASRAFIRNDGGKLSRRPFTQVHGIVSDTETAHAHSPCRKTGTRLPSGAHAVDVDPVRADHPVDVDEALVAALRGDLLGRELGAVDEAFRIALAERDVAGGVLVEKRVEEQDAALSRSARNAAPAPPRRGGGRPRQCRALSSAPPRRVAAFASTMRPPSKRTVISSISVPW